MLALRKLNWSYNELSEEFKVPKTTIRYLVRRFGLAGAYNPPIRGKLAMPHLYPKGSATRTTGKILYSNPIETTNPGKTYKQYLEDEKNRKWKRLTQGHIK